MCHFLMSEDAGIEIGELPLQLAYLNSKTIPSLHSHRHNPKIVSARTLFVLKAKTKRVPKWYQSKGLALNMWCWAFISNFFQSPSFN
jgi:hypothetical protein